MRKKIFLTTLFLLVLLCGSACADISKLTVSKAWKRITKAGDFSRVPVTYEKDSEPGAWVEREGGENYTVHVTRGMMKILDTEDEIAGVLAHELGHIRLGHDGTQLFSRSASGINSEIETSEANFNSNQEIEADRYGTELLKKARYNPRGLYDAVMKIRAVEKERLAHLAEAAGIVSGIKGDSVLGMGDIAEIMLGR